MDKSLAETKDISQKKILKLDIATTVIEAILKIIDLFRENELNKSQKINEGN